MPKVVTLLGLLLEMIATSSRGQEARKLNSTDSRELKSDRPVEADRTAAETVNMRQKVVTVSRYKERPGLSVPVIPFALPFFGLSPLGMMPKKETDLEWQRTPRGYRYRFAAHWRLRSMATLPSNRLK